MKIVVELAMFDKDGKKVKDMIFDTKTIESLAEIKKIDEIEDEDALDRLNDNLVELANDYQRLVDSSVHHFIIYNDYIQEAMWWNIGEIYPEDIYENYIR